MNIAFKNALARIPQDTPPIWFMRQAGRYHRHYQEMRSKHSFTELCKIPELAAEVAWGPIQDFDFDVSILFSDILFVLEALGLGLEYTDQGPRLDWHLRADSFSKLVRPDEAFESLRFQGEALKATREKLPKNKSLIGFVGAPWTLFTYAVQGRHDGHLIESKRQLPLYERFCREYLLPLLKKNIQLQLDSGAEIVMLFDTASGELSPLVYQKYVLPTVKELAQTFPQKLGYYSKSTGPKHLESPLFKAQSLFAGMGVDHRWYLPQLFKEAPLGFVQGNFDQALLFLEPDDFKKQFELYLEDFKALSPTDRAGWVCGLGHGVLPKTPEDNVRFFVQRVREVFHS